MTEDCICGRTEGPHSRKCNGRRIAVESARSMEEADRDLLRMLDDEKLSPARVAERMGYSRQNAGLVIRKARRRQALLASLK